MSKFKCQINDKCLNPKTFCSQICLVENLFGHLDFEFHLNFGLRHFREEEGS
jgi:hypothetical protein